MYAYANLRSLPDKTERELQIIAALESHLYDVCTTLRKSDPMIAKLADAIKRFTDGDMDGCIKIMDELSKASTTK